MKRKTNFYQPKQGKPLDCRTTLILQTKILKNTLPRDISGPATAGHFFNPRYLGARAKRVKRLQNVSIMIKDNEYNDPATTGKIKSTSTHSLSGVNNTKEQNVSIST